LVQDGVVGAARPRAHVGADQVGGPLERFLHTLAKRRGRRRALGRRRTLTDLHGLSAQAARLLLHRIAATVPHAS